MCQAYEGERASMVSGESRQRELGFNAFLEGKSCQDNPNNRWSTYNVNAWFIGWVTAKEGRELW